MPIGRMGQSHRTNEVTTHELNAVHLLIFLTLEIILDVPLIHPLGDQAQSVFT
jgi:hypothetical protein